MWMMMELWMQMMMELWMKWMECSMKMLLALADQEDQADLYTVITKCQIIKSKTNSSHSK